MKSEGFKEKDQYDMYALSVVDIAKYVYEKIESLKAKYSVGIGVGHYEYIEYLLLMQVHSDDLTFYDKDKNELSAGDRITILKEIEDFCKIINKCIIEKDSSVFSEVCSDEKNKDKNNREAYTLFREVSPKIAFKKAIEELFWKKK